MIASKLKDAQSQSPLPHHSFKRSSFIGVFDGWAHFRPTFQQSAEYPRNNTTAVDPHLFLPIVAGQSTQKSADPLIQSMPTFSAQVHPAAVQQLISPSLQ